MEYSELDILNENIRELKDENSRLHKLLKEKDLEITMIKEKTSSEASNAKNLLTNDVASVKIIELSKKLRECTAQLESEKTRTKQLSKRCAVLESKTFKDTDLINDIKPTEAETKKMVADEKSLNEKLIQCESKLTECRNQMQSLNNELKMAHKVLSQEIGGQNINIQSLLNSPGNWKGRAQQILILQKKISDLKRQIGDQAQSVNSCTNFAETEINSSRIEQKQIDLIKKMESKKYQDIEKLTSDYQQLQNDYENIKKAADAAKARSKTLSTENRTFKEQLGILIEKGQHDDELIHLLLNNQDKLKVIRNKLNRTLKK